MGREKKLAGRRLWDAYRQDGDDAARDALVVRNERLVYREAIRLHRRGAYMLELDDLVSAGRLGLVQAVESFDPSRGLAFSTYAVPRIRGAMMDELRRWDVLPRTARRRERSMARGREELAAALRRDPTRGELAAHLEVDTETLARWEHDAAAATSVSLEAASWGTGEDESRSLADVLAASAAPATETVGLQEELDIMRAAVAGLEERERQVLALYYYEELTLREIGELLGVTESRVSQIRSAILDGLREELGYLRAA